MVPEKTCAAQEETSEEQGSGKAPVRERWRGQKGGEQPPQAQGRGVCGTAGRCATYFCAVTRCSDSLSEWRVCVWGGLRAAVSAACVPRDSLVYGVNAVRYHPVFLCCSKCWWGVVLLIPPRSAPGLRQQMDTGGAPDTVDLCSFLTMQGSKGSASPLGLGCAGSCGRGRARPGGNGWRKGCLGGSWTASPGGCNAERASPPKKWRQRHHDPAPAL